VEEWRMATKSIFKDFVTEEAYKGMAMLTKIFGHRNSFTIRS
jgi:hypothetical protein